MDLKEQVCSLELAKRLCELGEPQESYWWWQEYTKRSIFLIPYKEAKGFLNATTPCKYYSAFTVAELGERLPKNLWTDKIIYGKEQVGVKSKGHLKLRTIECKKATLWCIGYACLESGKGDKFIFPEVMETSEANARAKMLIYLLENKLKGR